jgi:hypothetical protein
MVALNEVNSYKIRNIAMVFHITLGFHSLEAVLCLL